MGCYIFLTPKSGIVAQGLGRPRLIIPPWGTMATFPYLEKESRALGRNPFGVAALEKFQMSLSTHSRLWTILGADARRRH